MIVATPTPRQTKALSATRLLAEERDPADATPSTARGRGRRAVIEWGIILVAVVLGTVLLRTYVVQSFYIPSGSMLPTLQVGDRIIVDKLSYRFHDPHRGDIVVFARPPLEDQAYADLVKRVIGLPGETISSQNGAIYIDGKRLVEPWLPPGSQSYTGPLAGGDAHPAVRPARTGQDPGRASTT